MNCLKTALEFEEITACKTAYPVIIVAAGSASRMNGIDKLSALICGKPLLAHTICAFDNSINISEIIVVTTKEKISTIEEYKSTFMIKKPFSVILGGKSREESVYNGIKCLSDRYNKVLIHDGARPLVSDKVISNVCEALDVSDSVTCAVAVKDTIKTVNEDMFATKTLARDYLRSIQTPQGVLVSLFLKSAENNDLAKFTDDTSVVEAEGAATKIVDGDYYNIKVTTPEDLIIAETYLKREN